MKIHTISFLCLAMLLSACQQTNDIDKSKPNEVEIKKNADIVRSTKIKNSETPIGNKEIFYLTRNDIFNMPIEMQEHVVGMDLVIYHNCLSVKSIGEEEYFTFILSDENLILFDENQKIIGLINPKSNKKFLIGDNVELSGTNTVNATSSKKPVPKECSQTLLFAGEILYV
ncbi:hypothetical protein ACFBZI_03925 [Moraxella sp. ZJ142]|uniref:hypothetical protein n=1 Tax=Moraxella marmotae TaxID=3344520 RepID=UPI0035D4A1B9